VAVDTAMAIVPDEPSGANGCGRTDVICFSNCASYLVGLSTGATPIVPLLIGHETDAIRLAVNLRKRGLHVDPIKFPAVPLGGAQIRIQLNAKHTQRHIDHLVDAFSRNQALLEAGTSSHTLGVNLERARA
jgi:glycine C-acetyltransferase